MDHVMLNMKNEKYSAPEMHWPRYGRCMILKIKWQKHEKSDPSDGQFSL